MFENWPQSHKNMFLRKFLPRKYLIFVEINNGYLRNDARSMFRETEKKAGQGKQFFPLF